MATVKKHDFVEIEYTGMLKEDSSIFDTTQGEVAREHGVYDKNTEYSPAVICIGEGSMLEAVEEQLVGKETGKEYTFDVGVDSAFGKKDAKLIQMIPMNKFRQQNIQPFPGLQLNIDGVFGIVKTVSGGRCLVDFNHPLAGKDLVYKVRVNRIVEDETEKLKSLLKNHLGIKDADIEVKEGAATVSMKEELPKQMQENFRKIAAKSLTGIKNVNFVAGNK